MDNADEPIKSIIGKNNSIYDIVDIANITRTELRQDENAKRVVEIYQISVPFAKFNVSFGGQKFAWLVYGKNLSVESEQENMLQSCKNELQKIVKKESIQATIFAWVVLIGLCYGIYRLVKWLFF